MENIQRENEALMQPREVSKQEFKLMAGIKKVYGDTTTTAVRQIIVALNGLTIEQANTALDLARHSIKRLCKINF